MTGAEEQAEPNQRHMFQEQAVDRATSAWPCGGSAEEKWVVIKSALEESAAAMLETEQRHSPDWFRDSANDLQPVLKRRNALYCKWLATKRTDDLLQFRRARGEAQRAIRKAKNEWFKAKAAEAEKERFGGKRVWQCIRDMQRGRRGLLPSVNVTINDEDGNPCTSPAAQQQRWRRHFSSVLNMQSQYDPEELGKVRQRPLRPELAEKPSMRELTKAIGKLKNSKAGGSSGLLPEMVKAACDNEEFKVLLLDLTHTVWEERRAPKEWADAILVPIPKKGNLRNCHNWRGIALLEVVGKVVARILQERLQQLAKEELPESQCGFRKGRGCSDMIFTVRQLAEKAIEHQSKQFFLFVDLQKAYDSVPRMAMWRALEKLGVPDCIIDIIRSFHDGMHVQVRVNGRTLEEIPVENGLRQGCTMAPVLFNLYACLVVERWSARVKDDEGVGTYLQYKLDH